MEVSIEKSQQQANILILISNHLRELDADYLKEASKRMFNDANRQESIAVLNPRFNRDKTILMKAQSAALGTLVDYINILKECDELKTKIAMRDNSISEIEKLFS